MQKKKVLGYIRVSTEEQTKNGYGLTTQKNEIIKYCENNNLELIQVFEDQGITGKMEDNEDLSKRQGLTEALIAMEEDNIDYIIVMNTSRLWRDDSAKVFVVRTIRKSKKNIISIEQPRYSVYSKDPNEFLFNSMMEILDQYERMCINIKLAKGKRTAALTGKYIGGTACYGYTVKRDSMGNNPKSVIVPEQAKIIKQIYKLYINEQFGFQAIADILNNQGTPTVKGGLWLNATIAKILHNDFYCGMSNYGDIKVKGQHEAIISKELWDKAQAVKIRQRARVKKDKNNNDKINDAGVA